MSENCVIIPSKGRPHCVTAQYLSDIEYPSRWLILVGDDDDTIDEYVKKWGEQHVIVFDKEKAKSMTDLMDAYGDSAPSGVSPARNMVAVVARRLGLKRVWMFDDDYRDIVLSRPNGKRERLMNGKRLFEELDKVEEFGASTGIPVVGFGFSVRQNGAEYCTTFGNHVYNGFNIDVTEDGFTPFCGRLFEDGTHTMIMMRKGKTDFCFYHLYIEPSEQAFMHNKKKGGKQSGGLYDTYKFFGAQDDIEQHNENQVRNVGYPVMQTPISAKIVLKDGNPKIGKIYDSRYLQVKVLSERWCR